MPSAEVRDPAIDDQIAVLQSADVEVEVTAALRAHDLRWVGCAGVGIYVPGVTDEALIHSHGVRIIPNTTDGIDHASVRDLQPIADAYATAYNLALRRRLEERP